MNEAVTAVSIFGRSVVLSQKRFTWTIINNYVARNGDIWCERSTKVYNADWTAETDSSMSNA